VVKVKETQSGTWFLNFCENYRKCPFTVVVFRGNLRDVGDVRQLEGKRIEVHGRIQTYRGRTEIILRDHRQLRGEAAQIPPVPKDFDVQRKGRFSAGSIRTANGKSSQKKNTRSSNRREPPDEDDSSDPPD
jgi:DNA/RNA endonuclease YhcR with UshA esterase domain